VRALALLSGGLDSSLAAKLIADQGIEVVGVSFESPFFDAGGAREAAAELGIQLVVIDVSADVLRILKAPRYGFGKHMNPCIDCHALMVRRALGSLEELGASFIVTGEVVGQRPKSQMRFGLEAVERESGAAGLLLRPLSAQLLSPTVPEESGWVDRTRLLALHGRTRKPQFELAAAFGLTRFKSPAGGCLLADENYSRALRDLREHEQLSLPSVRLLAVGRQFRISERAKLVVGRNQAENAVLTELAPPGDLLLRAVDRKGPIAILSGAATEEDRRTAAAIVARYADAGPPESPTIRIQEGDAVTEVAVVPLPREQVRAFAI
jgi:tRNA U34 2-thiouridine synthase MnmA/TrmU